MDNQQLNRIHERFLHSNKCKFFSKREKVFIVNNGRMYYNTDDVLFYRKALTWWKYAFAYLLYTVHLLFIKQNVISNFRNSYNIFPSVFLFSHSVIVREKRTFRILKLHIKIALVVAFRFLCNAYFSLGVLFIYGLLRFSHKSSFCFCIFR